MNFFENLKNFFTGRISDEEIASAEWILCPNCQINYEKDIIIDNGGRCPKCGTKFMYDWDR